MRHVRSTKLNRSCGKQATCWTVDRSQSSEFIMDLVVHPPPRSLECHVALWRQRVTESRLKWAAENKQNVQHLSHAKHKLLTPKKPNTTSGTIHTLFIPHTEEWWKQTSPSGNTENDTKWTIRYLARTRWTKGKGPKLSQAFHKKIVLDMRDPIYGQPHNILFISPGGDGKKSLPLDVPSMRLTSKWCSGTCQKYQHALFPCHWLGGLITALTVLTEWKRGSEKNVSCILSGELFDKFYGTLWRSPWCRTMTSTELEGSQRAEIRRAVKVSSGNIFG